MMLARLPHVLSRNLSLSLAAGNATIWKPSHTTPLCSIAVTKIISGVLERNGIPGAVAGLVIGDKDVGQAVVESRDVDLGTFSTGLAQSTSLTYLLEISFVHR